MHRETLRGRAAGPVSSSGAGEPGRPRVLPPCLPLGWLSTPPLRPGHQGIQIPPALLQGAWGLQFPSWEFLESRGKGPLYFRRMGGPCYIGKDRNVSPRSLFLAPSGIHKNQKCRPWVILKDVLLPGFIFHANSEYFILFCVFCFVLGVFFEAISDVSRE